MATYVFGYARVSTKEQNLDRQLLKFEQLGIDMERHCFTDEESGKNFDRKGYQAMKQIVRPGDLIYFDALDRLGRNFDGIIDEWKHFTRELNVDIVVLENPELFDSRKFRQQGDIGKMIEHMFLGLLAYVADQERKKMLQRQKEGIAVALAKGVKFGREKIEIDEAFEAAYAKWKAGEQSAADTWRSLGMTKATFYRRAKELKGSE